jgi:uncharacterized protein YjiS (DUF1127 family)
MEMAMCRNDEHDLPNNLLELPPEEWDRFKRDLSGRVHEARQQAIRAAGRGLANAVLAFARLIADTIAGRWAAFARQRERWAAIRELHALDDRTLRDIGLGRSEIESAIVDPERRLAREFAVARRPPRPVLACAGARPKPAPATTTLIDRSAA